MAPVDAPSQAPAAVQAVAKTATPDHYESYTEAYRVAQKEKRPMIVILNPPKTTQVAPVSLEEVRKTQGRRDLLQDYVIAVVDTGTPHGKKVHEHFGSPQLPRISVIDNQQAMQVYQTSQPMYGQLWDKVLTVFHNATPTTRMPAASYCPSCQLYQNR
jgi:hypothetical protein